MRYSIGGNVGYYTAGSSELAKGVYRNLKETDIVALEKHGVTAKGKDLQKIVDMIEVIDYYCKIAVLQCGKETIVEKIVEIARQIREKGYNFYMKQ